jgi:precorrin-6y C5,15-methyltransferase (decarboxylating) CbiE subunit
MEWGMNKITIIGCGPGSPDFMTPAALKAAREADYLIGSKRLLDMISGAKGERLVTAGDKAAVIKIIEEKLPKGSVAALVSGDPGISSLARPLVGVYGRERCRVIPGVSSVQAAFAAIGEPWQDARIISAHKGNPEEAGPEADAYAILLGRPEAIRWAASFAARLKGEWDAWVCENLTLPNERITKMDAAELAWVDSTSLAVALLVRRRTDG